LAFFSGVEGVGDGRAVEVTVGDDAAEAAVVPDAVADVPDFVVVQAPSASRPASSVMDAFTAPAPDRDDARARSVPLGLVEDCCARCDVRRLGGGEM